jgi:hypothetical protein
VGDGSHARVRDGAESPVLLRGYVDFILMTSDWAATRFCSGRALSLGPDSTWHLLRLAYLNFRHGDTTGVPTLFDRAILAARDTSSLGELSFPLMWQCPLSWGINTNPLVWSIRQRTALSDSSRLAWVHRLATAHSAGGDNYQAYLARRYARLGYDGVNFLVYYPEPRDPPIIGGYIWDAQPLPTYPAIGLQSHLYRLWDPANGAAVGLVAYAIQRKDIIAPKAGATRPIELALRQWGAADGGLQDTVTSLSVSGGNASSSSLTGYMFAPSSRGVTSWTLVVTQGRKRRSRVVTDLIGAPAFSISTTGDIPRGVSDVTRALDLSRLGDGDYRLEVQVTDRSGALLARAVTRLRIK